MDIPDIRADSEPMEELFTLCLTADVAQNTCKESHLIISLSNEISFTLQEVKAHTGTQ